MRSGRQEKHSCPSSLKGGTRQVWLQLAQVAAESLAHACGSHACTAEITRLARMIS